MYETNLLYNWTRRVSKRVLEDRKTRLPTTSIWFNFLSDDLLVEESRDVTTLPVGRLIHLPGEHWTRVCESYFTPALFRRNFDSSRLSISCYFGRHLSETRDVILVISPSCVSRNEQFYELREWEISANWLSLVTMTNRINEAITIAYIYEVYADRYIRSIIIIR